MLLFLLIVSVIIPAKPLHKSGAVSIYFNHLYYRDLLQTKPKEGLSNVNLHIYIYLNVDKC